MIMWLEETTDPIPEGPPPHALAALHTATMQGPEIRTGFLKNPDQPLTFTAGKTIKITTDYEHKGDDEMISMRCGRYSTRDPWDARQSAHPD